jgi:hypothetical protein
MSLDGITLIQVSPRWGDIDVSQYLKGRAFLKRLPAGYRHIRGADVVGIENALQAWHPENCVIHEEKKLAITCCTHDLVD